MQLIGIANDGNDQSALAADRDTDIVIVVVNDVISVNARVDFGKFPERFGTGFNKERHETQRDAMFFQETVFIGFAQGNDLAHIDLIEGGQHRRFMPRLHQMSGNLFANLGHRYPGDAFCCGHRFCFDASRLRSRRFCGGGSGGRLFFCLGRGLIPGCFSRNIVDQDASVTATAA